MIYIFNITYLKTTKIIYFYGIGLKLRHLLNTWFLIFLFKNSFWYRDFLCCQRDTSRSNFKVFFLFVSACVYSSYGQIIRICSRYVYISITTNIYGRRIVLFVLPTLHMDFFCFHLSYTFSPKKFMCLGIGSGTYV